jgi:outer membrane protein assembly factor BamB
MPHLPRSSTLIAGLTVASLLAITLPAAAQSTFHGDVARTGVYPDDGPVPVGALKWSFTAGGAIVGSPAVVDGTVYFGALDGHLHAVDAATGTEKWKFKSRMPIACTPTVTGGTVYITSSAGSLAALDAAYVGCHNGTLYAFNARTGALDWSFRTEGSRRDPLKLLDAELRLDQAAFHPVTGDFGDMYIDFYRFTTVGGIMASPAVVDGVVYFGSLDGNLYALR